MVLKIVLKKYYNMRKGNMYGTLWILVFYYLLLASLFPEAIFSPRNLDIFHKCVHVYLTLNCLSLSLYISHVSTLLRTLVGINPSNIILHKPSSSVNGSLDCRTTCRIQWLKLRFFVESCGIQF